MKPETDEQIEQEIQDKGLTAPRITKEDLSALIVGDQYIQPEGTTLTICVLTLQNGFTVTGESASASPENFDPEIGKKAAFQNAYGKIWQLAGYELRHRMANTPAADVSAAGVHPETVCAFIHEANRLWCQMNGDFSQPSWVQAEDWQRMSTAQGVDFLTTYPEAGPEATHENWMQDKEADGWTYGETKDPEAKTHPCMVPFEELPPHQQIKDKIFHGLVHALLAVE